MLQWPSAVKVWLHFRDCSSSVKRLQSAASSPPTPASSAALPVRDCWADWSLSSQVCTTVVKKEKGCACMSALLSSPSPPQIMPLIINRMRACSSWKAGTGTSLLNGAAQLGLKLFNRNMKAPSVRRTRPSEVTRLSLPIQQTCPPGTGPAAPGAGVCPAPRLFPSTGLLLSPSTSWSTQLPFLLFFPAGTLPPLCQAVFSLTSSSSQAGALCSSPCKAGLIFAAVLPLGWDGHFCAGCRSLCSCTQCVPHSPFSPSGEAGLSRARLCSTLLWS